MNTKLGTLIANGLLRTADKGVTDLTLGGALVAVSFYIWHCAHTITLMDMKFIGVV